MGLESTNTNIWEPPNQLLEHALSTADLVLSLLLMEVETWFAKEIRIATSGEDKAEPPNSAFQMWITAMHAVKSLPISLAHATRLNMDTLQPTIICNAATMILTL